MKRIRVSKVRVTDHRPPGAGASGPLERKPSATRGGSMTGLDHLAAIQTKDAANHDSWVATYSPAMLEAAYEDLRQRGAWDRKNSEHRWVMGRLAAIKRAAMAMQNRRAA